MDISNKRHIQISGKNIVVIGIGESGKGAASLAKHLGANVLISDSDFNPKMIELSKLVQTV